MTDMPSPGHVADRIFVALIGDEVMVDNEEVRSEPFSETVDVCVDGHWFRIAPQPIAEPIPPSEGPVQ